MNLFRSEKHVKNWSGFKEGTDAGILTLKDLMAFFSTQLHTEKLSRHYVSSIANYKEQFMAKIKLLRGDQPFWSTSSK